MARSAGLLVSRFSAIRHKLLNARRDRPAMDIMRNDAKRPPTIGSRQ